jgi:hypothetical protein
MLKFFLAMAITFNSYSSINPGQFKGSLAIQGHLNTYIFAEKINLKTYSLTSVEHILGLWRQLDDGTTVYINGHPNGFNLSVYHLLFEQLSIEISQVCDPILFEKVKTKFRPEFIQSLLPICQWPKNSAKETSVLFNFWSKLIGFDAPSDEFNHWLQFFSREFVYNDTASLIKSMAMTIFYSPYFLLQL